MARQKWKEWAENEKNLTVLSAWARAGMTDEQIAKQIGISRSTFAEWKKKHDSIREAVEQGNEFANRLVENSLYQMTQGFKVTVRKAFKVKDVEYENGKRIKETERLETAEEDEYIKPDVRAIMFYLENRMQDRWKKKIPEAATEDAEGQGIVVLTAQQIEKLKEEVEEHGKKETRTGEETIT